ncbi:MAG: hypothetical protein IJB80_04495 [Clostridia bacterium]|nr:hypothetical protein [Clostridia bacterium]
MAAYAQETTTYYEDFVGYTGGKLVSDSTSLGNWISGNWGQAEHLKAIVDENGNAAMNVEPTQTGGVYSSVYVYAKYQFAQETSEMVHIGFKIKGQGLDAVNDSLIDIYPTTKTGGDGFNIFYIGSGGLYEMASGTKKGLVEWEDNKVYDINLIVDIGNRKLYVYIDGELKSTTDLPQTYNANNTNVNLIDVKAMRFRLGGLIDWMDDFKISKLSYGDFTASVSEIDRDENKIKVTFNNSINAATDRSVDSYKLVNLMTGEEVALTGVNVNRGETDDIEVFSAVPLTDGTEYQLLLPDGFKDIAAKTLKGPILFHTSGTGFYATKLRLIDYQNKEYTLAEEKLPAKINKLQIWFSNAIDDACLNKTDFSLETAAGDVLDYRVDEGSENSVILSLNGYLYGETDYVLNVSDAVHDGSDTSSGYVFEFSTDTGTFEVKALEILNNGVSIEDISDATGTLVVKVELVKTLREKRDLILSYSLWNERLMKGFNFQKVSMAADDTASAPTLSITIDALSDITAIKGFLWDTFSDMNAVCDEIIIN